MSNGIAHLLTPEADAKVASLIWQAAADDAPARRAASEPLPGALRDAFAIPQSIKVGPHTIRPFWDFDFELLTLLDHPLHRIMVAGERGEKTDEQYSIRGPQAWLLAYLFTTPVREVDKIVEECGKDEVTKRAKEFAFCQLAELLAINKAITVQMRRYWEPVIGHGSEEDANAPANPSPSQPPTV